MSERGEALARQYEQMNNDLIVAVEQCPDAQWSARCPDTGWTANVQAHHIAWGQQGLPHVLGAYARGENFQNMDSATLDQMNAKHAQDYANVSKDEVIADLRKNGGAAADWLRSLTDEQLDRMATFREGMPPASIEQMIRFILFGEIERHGGNLRQAIGAAS